MEFDEMYMSSLSKVPISREKDLSFDNILKLLIPECASKYPDLYKNLVELGEEGFLNTERLAHTIKEYFETSTEELKYFPKIIFDKSGTFSNFNSTSYNKFQVALYSIDVLNVFMETLNDNFSSEKFNIDFVRYYFPTNIESLQLLHGFFLQRIE